MKEKENKLQRSTYQRGQKETANRMEYVDISISPASIIYQIRYGNKIARSTYQRGDPILTSPEEAAISDRRVTVAAW